MGLTPSNEVLGIVADLEAVINVSECNKFEWNVWPIVRQQLANMVQGKTSASNGEQQVLRAAGSASKVANYVNTVRNATREFGFNRRNICDKSSTCAILAGSDREAISEGRSINYIADPLRRKLDEVGLGALVFEIGRQRKSALHPHQNVTNRIAIIAKLYRRMVRLNPPNEPSWFLNVRSRLLKTANIDPSWRPIAERICSIEASRYAFRHLLASYKFKTAFIDTWSGIPSAGATLACRQLGIKTVELQHGQQANHWCYREWKNVPSTGFEVIPDLFWHWGDVDRDAAADSNSHFFAEHVTSGNLWLNAWRGVTSGVQSTEVEKLKKLSETDGQRIVVAGHLFLDSALLAELSAKCPASWVWFVRPHRSMGDAEVKRFTRPFTEKCSGRVIVEEATHCSLPALLRIADCLVTGCSTSALEALCFGTPTVLCQNIGRVNFQRYVNAGVMFHATEVQGLLQCLHLALKVTAEQCTIYGDQLFGTAESSQSAVREILQYCNKNANSDGGESAHGGIAK